VGEKKTGKKGGQRAFGGEKMQENREVRLKADHKVAKRTLGVLLNPNESLDKEKENREGGN